MTVSEHEADNPSQSPQQINYEELEAAYERAVASGNEPNLLPPLDHSIDVLVTIPADTAVALKRSMSSKLDIASAASLVLQLYSAAPLDRGAVTLTHDQHIRICTALGHSPQSVDELVSSIEELVRITFGGVRIKLTAEEVGIMNARNATGLKPAEFATQELRRMFDAWRDGRI